MTTENEPTRAEQTRRGGPLDVPDGDAPSAENVAARLDVGSAEYHESCCSWALWSNDQSLFKSMPSCTCGGPEMAKVYVRLREFVEKIAADFGPDGGYQSGWRCDGGDLGYIAKEALDGR